MYTPDTDKKLFVCLIICLMTEQTVRLTGHPPPHPPPTLRVKSRRHCYKSFGYRFQGLYIYSNSAAVGLKGQCHEIVDLLKKTLAGLYV